ncbi:MAG: hypothetical protein LWW94_11445, partial [Candidatus Desulfofervidaceae bacterium]|nr:hypothetical protein [Candidatus Desulfofervidaceae bacterium]
MDLVFFDTTSIKFYGEENELMQRGLSKDKVLTRADRYQKIKDNLFIKEIKLNQKRYIICFN